jgi:methylated-DNA-[protein]-cysteine S-methyltransferase
MVGDWTFSLRGNGRALVGLDILSWPGELRARAVGSHPGGTDAPPTDPVLGLAARELARYLAGELRAFSVPVEPKGTPFQIRCWEYLRSIPFGETRSYAEESASVDERAGTASRAGRIARAVGQANARNPIPLVIPCHRVVRADGSLGGYALGPALKARLLALEDLRVVGDRLIRP